MSDDSDSNKKLYLVLILLIGAIVVLTASIIYLEEVEAKKVLKKVEPLKDIQFKKGKYAPKQIKQNSTHIQIIQGYCTCGKHKWKRQNFLLEKKVIYTKNNKEITRGKKYKLRISPKLSFNRCGGEFTVYNPGTTTNGVDICFCGREKSQKGKSWYQFYMKKVKL